MSPATVVPNFPACYESTEGQAVDAKGTLKDTQSNIWEDQTFVWGYIFHAFIASVDSIIDVAVSTTNPKHTHHEKDSKKGRNNRKPRRGIFST